MPGVVLVNDETLKRLAELAAERTPKQFDDGQRATLVEVAEIFGEPERRDHAVAYFERVEFWAQARKFGSSQVKTIAYIVATVTLAAQFKDQVWSAAGVLWRAARTLGGG